MHQSIATIDSPEFLNLQPLDINPLMSKCEIKVFYLGANRNHSYISEQVAVEIGKTLRGAPIVGYYRDTKEDFTDHGEKIIIDDEGIKFECQTVPYGFVSPDAKVWFQNFDDVDEFGNHVIRKYLMTTGYLWTEQFPESSLPVKQGRPQSMELNDESVQGHWATDASNGIDFFIINDAIIQKICILGEDVQPCFEGASVTAPEVSAKFTLDKTFKNTLFSMMQDLKNALEMGGQQKVEVNTNFEAIDETPVSEVEENFSQNEDKIDEMNSSENVDNVEDTSDSTEVTDSEDSGETAPETFEKEKEEDSSEEKEQEQEQEEEEKEDKDEKYTLLQNEFNLLKQDYDTLNAQYQELVQFKKQIDNQRKDALIAEFYMLSDEDKKDVIDNKEKYSYDDIKAKLSIICFDKKINFSLTKEEEKAEENVIVYNIGSDNENNSLPDWVRAVKEQEKFS